MKLNFRDSANRPAWTSEWETGMWGAYNHLHLYKKLKRNYFIREKRRGGSKHS